MSPTPEESQNRDDLNVLVFHDQLPPRAFRMKRSWIPRLGWILLVNLGVALCSIAIAIYYFRASVRHERELKSLKQPSFTGTAPTEAPAEIPTVTPTFTPSDKILPSKVFEGFPKGKHMPIEPAWVQIAAPSAVRTGKNVQVSFRIEYTGPSGGSQQGRILVLARGEGALFAYPKGAILTAGESVLIQPQNGESFSVSRFRAAETKFGPIEQREWIQEVEIFLFDMQNNLLASSRTGVK